MCRKVEGKDILAAALLAAFLFLGPFEAASQSVCGININSATRAELDSLHLLSPFKIESILAYRKERGEILSAAELSLVDGFTEEDVEALEAFVSFDPVPAGKRPSHTFTTRFNKKRGAEGFAVTSKYDWVSPALSAGVTLDNDAMERYPDFVSGSVTWKSITAGDYRACFGQGLVAWNGMSFSTFGEPAALMKRESGIRPHRSSDESDFLRGAAWKKTTGRASVSLFGSAKGCDARIVDGAYTSIAVTGLHVTETERERKNSMHEYLAGANVTVSAGTWRIGATAVAYSYDRPCGKRVTKDNRYQIYDGLWANAGVNFFGSVAGVRLYGEAAVDRHGAPAAVAGSIWSPSYNLEMSLQGSVFSPSYIAAHSAGTTHDRISGEYAVRAIAGRWQFNGNASYSLKPTTAEAVFKYRLAVTYSAPSGFSALYQFRNGNHRFSLKVPFGGGFYAAARAEGKRDGYAFYGEGTFKRPKFELSARFTRWNTKDWDSRVYLYERSIPQTFSTQAYYGKGKGAYLFIRYAPFTWLDLWMKVQQGYCSAFILIFIPG